jgi:alpha-ribazole phosphatase/probable phosphoglycerate mutase
VAVHIVFETHSLTEDNEAGRATGWLPGKLSSAGRAFAAEIGRRRAEGHAAVFSSDLRRAVETAEIAFGGTAIPVLLDWRLRECDYGSMNGGEASEMHAQKSARLDRPYPNGESWRQAVERGGWFLRDIAARCDGMSILLIGHVATKWALDHHVRGVPLEELVTAPFEWQEGWSYDLSRETLGTHA